MNVNPTPPIVVQPLPQTVHELILSELQKQTPLLQTIAAYLNNGAKA